MNPIHAQISYLYNIHFYTNLPSTRGSSKRSFPLRFPQQSRAYISLPPYVLHAPSNLSSLIWLPENFWWEAKTTKLLVIQSSPSSCYFPSLRPKILPRPVWDPPQPMFYHYYKRQCFTPIENKRQTDGSAHLNSYILGQQREQLKILDQMVAEIPWILSTLIFEREICTCKVYEMIYMIWYITYDMIWYI